jgi:metal-dependent hydrolase (beta-lactamase superfamily II)
MADSLLQEDGFSLLQEDGSKILLETGVAESVLWYYTLS